MSEYGVVRGATKLERVPPRTAGRRRAGDGAVVTVYEDGPLIVRGQFVINAQDGQPLTAGRRTVALCRCGRSAIRPFCDGSHTRINFRAAGGDQRARPTSEDHGGGCGERQPPPGAGDTAAQPASHGEPAAD
jgi:CDGSH-type Zn-finger protein